MPEAKQHKPLPLKPARPAREEAPAADLADVYEVLRSGVWFLVLFPLLAAGAALAVAFLYLPPTYESRTAIIPMESESSSETMLTDFLDPLPLTLELKRRDESKGVLAFLNSRLLKSRLIEKHDLLPVLYPERWDHKDSRWTVPEDEVPTTVSALQDEVMDEVYEVEHDADAGLIYLSWLGPDPGLCAEMLSSVLRELETYLLREYVSDAARNRAFLEEQTDRAAAEVRDWESRVPGPGLSAPAIAREIEAARTVYVELKRRLALAKIAEAERRPDFKVLDPPFTPEIWDKLPRILATLLIFLGALALALTILFGRRFARQARAERASRPSEA